MDTDARDRPANVIPLRTRRHKAAEGVCSYCDAERKANSNFHPPHDASERCQSGKHAHCSCGTCF